MRVRRCAQQQWERTLISCWLEDLSRAAVSGPRVLKGSIHRVRNSHAQPTPLKTECALCCDLIFGGGDDLAVDVNLLPLGEELG